MYPYSLARRAIVLPFVLTSAWLPAGVSHGQGPGTPPEIIVPAVDIGAVQMELRGQQQREKAGSMSAFHGFQFSDELEKSGIRFRHTSTDDGRQDFKMVHYDHGNGIAVADVDGDDRYDVYFLNQIGSNQLWRNLGDGRFEDITRQAGVGLEDRVSVTASFADIDNDGDADLFVTTVRMGNVLFENKGNGKFKDITEKAGLSHVGHSSGAVFFDYDLDGLLDLFVTNVGKYTVEERGAGGYYVGYQTDAFQGHHFPERYERSILYRNLGRRRFQDVSTSVDLVDEGWAGDASAGDVNNDGYPDLYVLNMQGDDHYYESLGGTRFVEKTAEYFPRTPWGAMGVKFFDYDNDGRMDLYITDMHSDMSEEVGPPLERDKSIITWSDEYLQGGANNIFGNAFYRNTGSAPWDEVSDLVQAENYWPWGFSVGDLNADGFQDVFIAASMSYPYRYGVNTVLLNEAGERFFHGEFLLGVEPRREGRTKTPLFELECLGGQETDPLRQEVCAGREGRFTVVGSLGTRASVMFDLDDDGDLDIITSEFNAEPQILVSDLSTRKPLSYLKIRLLGRRSNHDGLGARVTVKAGESSYVQVHDGKSGYLSQSSLPLYFGLGESQVDRIEVVWPSGERQAVTEGIRPNSTLEIVESASSSISPGAP